MVYAYCPEFELISTLHRFVFSPFVSSDFRSPGLKDAGQLSESSYAKAPPPHGNCLHIYGLCWVVKDQLTRHFYQAAAAQDKLVKYCVLVQSKVWDGTRATFFPVSGVVQVSCNLSV